ncbi:TylF/MycF/NovP-related O-methyltransferase [Asticcacaulis sp.]|uniref:TylF/MycF/NovP-related O-methyltransferase n=1 Tax=Asticcacaulis sp. TaxID=1872648 RepID=UPI002BE9EACA|nr:TylF/MycF/NovP-related O-methyltransferase [Asticcacaulis sp.]HTM82588.1 TylF/MycF/NovP-related O-methyltransferase [Asticcacaulis sp.]
MSFLGKLKTRATTASLEAFVRDRMAFDADFYTRFYDDVRENGVDPLAHFVNHGFSEGRLPNADLSIDDYLDLYAEMRAMPALATPERLAGLKRAATTLASGPVKIAKMSDRGANYLPPMREIGGWLEGRNIREGYQRAWGLRYDDLYARVDRDTDFQAAYEPVQGRCIIEPSRVRNLFLLFKFFLPAIDSGDIIEFGSYRGGGAIFMALLARKFRPGATVYALDTYEGMPQTDQTLDAHKAGDFNDSLLSEVEAARDALGLTNLVYVKGLFQDTAPTLLPGKRFALAHIDADIYSGVAYAYDVIRDYMVPKGYYVFDDATEASCIGATAAVEEYVVRRDGRLSEQIYPHWVFRAIE